jgi:hypothetical protein
MRAIHSLGSTFLVVASGTTFAQPAATAPPAAAPSAATPSSAAPAALVEPATTSAPAAVETRPWQFGIAPRLGLLVPTSKLGTMVLGGLELDYVVPAANRQLVVGVDLSLTRPSYDGSAMDPRIATGTAMYTIHETEMVVGATIGYRLFPADHALVPWGALGPVLHLLKTSESSTIAPGTNTATSTELGLELAAGVDYRTGPGFLLGGARLVYSNLDHTLTGDTNAGKLAIEVGYRIVF